MNLLITKRKQRKITNFLGDSINTTLNIEGLCMSADIYFGTGIEPPI